MNGIVALAAAGHAGPNRDGWVVIVVLAAAIAAALLLKWRQR